MRHLFSSVVQVIEPVTTMEHGAISGTAWAPVEQMFDANYGKLSYLKCRLDLQFIRPGKDILPAPVNGAAPDRQGLMFCSITQNLKAGQRIKCIAGPIVGTFEIRTVPDIALEYRGGHHIEVQVFEVAQNRLNGKFPGREPTSGFRS